MLSPQWHYCPTHNRLCEIGAPRDETPEQAGWRLYQAAVRETIRAQWEDRQAILLWLGIVEATHRDPYTMSVLEGWLRLNRWPRVAVEWAQQLADRAGAEAMAR